LFDFLKLLCEERQLRNVLLLRFAAQRGEHFAERGVQLVTTIRKNMKPRIVLLWPALCFVIRADAEKAVTD